MMHTKNSLTTLQIKFQFQFSRQSASGYWWELYDTDEDMKEKERRFFKNKLLTEMKCISCIFINLNEITEAAKIVNAFIWSCNDSDRILDTLKCVMKVSIQDHELYLAYSLYNKMQKLKKQILDMQKSIKNLAETV